MEKMVQVSALAGFEAQLAEYNVALEAVLSKARLQVDVLADDDSYIAYSSFLNLLEIAADETGCPHFGLALSARQSFNIFGALGLVMREAPDVRAALVALIRYFRLHNQGASVELSDNGQLAQLSFTVHEKAERTRQQYDLALGIGNNLLKMLCGHRWQPQRFFFPHTEPNDLKPFKAVFKAPMHFNQEVAALLFDAELLDIRFEQSDGRRFEILKSHVVSQLDTTSVDLHENVRRVLRKSMMNGDCSIDSVARYFSVSPRTLQRHLDNEGVSFKGLLEETRFEAAKTYLADTRLTLTQVADILCYSDLSAFSRAFKRCAGVSPRQWRIDHARTN